MVFVIKYSFSQGKEYLTSWAKITYSETNIK